MANVLITFYLPIIDESNLYAVVCYYESLAKELNKFGNNTKLLNVALFKEYFDVKLSENSVVSRLYQEIKSFNPDVILTFNNQIFEKLYDITNCPICIFNADSFEIFCAKEKVKQYKERYYLINSYKNYEYDEFLKFGIDKKRIINIHQATSIKRENLEKDKNISFIGSELGYDAKFLYKYLSRKEIYNIMLDYWNKGNYDYVKILKKHCPKVIENIPYRKYYGLFDSRLYVLASLMDLGLTIYGAFSDNLKYLHVCYDKTPCYTLQHNQDIYNSSKINISISHPQCRSVAYSWRTYDIMASSGLLITSYSELLENQIKEHVNIPMYKSMFEARDMCKYALNNPNYCEDIISASNEYIEKYGRWDDNFKTIQDAINVKLINTDSSNDNNKYSVIQYTSILRYGKLYKTQGIPYIFQILTYKKGKQKNKIVKLFNIKILKFKKRA